MTAATLYFLTLTFCAHSTPAPNAKCWSVHTRCTIDVCADFIREGREGHYLDGFMAATRRGK